MTRIRIFLDAAWFGAHNKDVRRNMVLILTHLARNHEASVMWSEVATATGLATMDFFLAADLLAIKHLVMVFGEDLATSRVVVSGTSRLKLTPRGRHLALWVLGVK